MLANVLLSRLHLRLGDQEKALACAHRAASAAKDAPYARVFVPAGQRTSLREGQRFDVRIQGIDQSYTGELRTIEREPSFTPYYALSGEDASRLVYRAEIVLTDATARDLPAGLPLTATPRDSE